MTKNQFFFNLEMDKQVIVETDENLVFFEKNPEEQDSYLAIFQDRVESIIYIFTKERLENFLCEAEILKHCFVGKVHKIEANSIFSLHLKVILEKLKSWFIGK